MTSFEKSKIYTKMLEDFMSNDGKYASYLTDKQWWEIHKLGDGVHELYDIQYQSWEPSWTTEHIFKSSYPAKAKMVNAILDIINSIGLKTEVQEIEPIPEKTLV